MPWASRLPDLRPIENVWNMVVRRVRQNPVPARYGDEIWLSVNTAWTDTPQQDIQKLFYSREHRVAEINQHHGGYTH